MPNEIQLLLDLSTVDAEESLRNFLPVKEELKKKLALCNMRNKEAFNVAMTTGAAVFKTSSFKMEDFLHDDQSVDQCEDIPRFGVNGRKRKRSVEVAEKVHAQEYDVTQPEKKMRHSVFDNIPLTKDISVAGWSENHAKFPSKGKDTSRSSINILRLVKCSDNYYTCEIINTTGEAKKQPTRDHSKDSCLDQNLAANSLSKNNRNCSVQVACLDKVEQAKVEVVQEATKSSFARVSQLNRKSTPCSITQITCDNFDRPDFNEIVPGPKECKALEPALEPALEKKESETKPRNLFDVLQRMKRALVKDRSNKKKRKGPVRTPTFVRIRKQVGNLFEMRARIISRNLRS